MWRQEEAGCLPLLLSILFVSQGLSLNLKLAYVTKLADQQAPETLLSLPSQPWEEMQGKAQTGLAFYVDAGESGIHGCAASTVHAELSPESPVLLLIWFSMCLVLLRQGLIL